MAKLILTRFLYIFDEVCISFITSLLKKHDLEECYFWLSELYLSGYDKQCWDLIWFVYYDFYYVLNPQFEEFIIKKHESSSNNPMLSLMTIVKNMHKMNSSSQVFITRQYNASDKQITQLFRGKKPSWLNDISNKYHGLFRYIDKHMYHFAVSSLPEIKSDENENINININNNCLVENTQKTTIDDLFDNALIYFSRMDKSLTIDLINDLKQNILTSHYTNYVHKTWAKLCLLIFNSDFHKSKKKMYISCLNGEYNKIMNIHQEPILLTSSNNKQIYKTLFYKRIYSITPLCSSFHLSRNSHCSMIKDNINDSYWYHWEYFAYLCPVWQERMNKFDITVDDENNKIIFKDDDECEQFYEEYGYEPDEQSRETQEKSILHMESSNWEKWYCHIFGEKSIHNFPKDYQFTY